MFTRSNKNKQFDENDGQFVPYGIWNGSEQHISNGKSMEKTKSTLGPTTGALLVLVTLSIVLIKFCVQFSGKPILLLLTDTSLDIMTKTKILTTWTITNYGYILWPFLCGIAVSIFTWAMVYFDSDIPGINPPSPLSPRKSRYRYQSERSCHLSYLMSIASGTVVFFLLYLSNAES